MSRLPTSEEKPVRPGSRRTPPSDWSRNYGAKHRFRRVTTFLAGVVPPQRVCIYWRGTHHLLQWWEPAARRNLARCIDGNLVNAIAEARKIEERLSQFRSSGQGRRRLGHADDFPVKWFLVEESP